MLLFGHPGITLGVAVLLNGLWSQRRGRRTGLEDNAQPHQETSVTPDGANGGASRFLTLSRKIDIRLLLLGSLLPDLIDKPVGQILFRENISNGRVFAHTLLFLVILSLVGFYLYRQHGKSWLLVLSFGTSAHIVLDEMWLVPQTLLWPLYGSSFDKLDLTRWTGDIFYALFHEPAVFVPELIGLVVLLWLAWQIVRAKSIYSFLRYGRVNEINRVSGSQ